MHSSLRQIDIVAQTDNGRPLLVQTDHREVAEVDAEVEVSVLFALARLLGPRQTDYPDPVVRYVALSADLHPALARVVAATGAEAEAAGRRVDLSNLERVAVADLAEAAFADLGRRLLAEHGLSADETGLAAYEDLVKDTPRPEEDEITYYRAVAGLAAVTGEVARALHGGRWVVYPSASPVIPFMFEISRGLVLNPVDKAERFLAHGEAQSPRQLLAILTDVDEPDGPILFSLRPSTWAPVKDLPTEPFAPTLAQSGADIPLLVYGRNKPQSFAMVDRGALGDLDAARAEALRNLAAVDVAVERVEVEQLTIWTVQGNYFAAEKILDEALMKRLHDEVDSPILLAGVPVRGQLLVTDGARDASGAVAFVGLVQLIFAENEGGAQISPTVFVITEGRLVGVAQLGD